MYTSAGGSSAESPVTATTGRFAAASSSSRSRVTPGFTVAIALDPQAWHTEGRTVPHRRHTNAPASSCATAASQATQRWIARHERQASSRARPVVFSTHTTRRSWLRK
jgi:hypothetical protein